MRAKSRPGRLELSSAEWTAARARALADSLPNRLSRLDAARQVTFGGAYSAGIAEAEAVPGHTLQCKASLHPLTFETELELKAEGSTEQAESVGPWAFD